MPQLDPTFFSTQLVWLFLTLVPLYLILRRAVLPRIGEVLEARQRHIDTDLEKATRLRQEAEAVLADYEKALTEARGRAAEAVKQAGAEMAAASARRHEVFGQELAKTTREAEGRIARAKEEALAQVSTVANEVAAAVTAKLIGTRPPGEQVETAVKEAMGGRG
jgi:F-type H+-transporting ATPase subunit b